MVYLVGRVGRDPEKRGTDESKSCLVFSLATNTYYSKSSNSTGKSYKYYT